MDFGTQADGYVLATDCVLVLGAHFRLGRMEKLESRAGREEADEPI